jgi:hypothetical protein
MGGILTGTLRHLLPDSRRYVPLSFRGCSRAFILTLFRWTGFMDTQLGVGDISLLGRMWQQPGHFDFSICNGFALMLATAGLHGWHCFTHKTLIFDRRFRGSRHQTAQF